MSYCPSCFEIAGTCACGPVSSSPKKPAKAPRAKAGSHKRPASTSPARVSQDPYVPGFGEGLSSLWLAIAVLLQAIREHGFVPSRENTPTYFRAQLRMGEALHGRLAVAESEIDEAKVCLAALQRRPATFPNVRALDWFESVAKAIAKFIGGGRSDKDWSVLSAAVWGWEKERLRVESDQRAKQLIAKLEDGNTPELAMVAAEIMADKAEAGESVEINVDVVSSAGFKGRFGHSYVMKGRCDGLAVTWFSTRETKAGTTVLVKGIPEHRVYRGVAEWLLKRPKVLKVVEV